jgi:sec-independent protein translocase protein TatB
MFGSVGLGEVLLLAVLGLFVFGPERLPGAVAEFARGVRKVRELANDVRAQVSSELGPEFRDVGDLGALAEIRRELAELRRLDPRVELRERLWGDDAAVPAPRAVSGDGAGGWTGGGHAVLARRPITPLAPNELPPVDPEAT